MQKNLPSHFELAAIEDTLLTRDYFSARKRTSSIDAVARDEAKKIINQAWQKSDEIKKEAFNHGFETGLIYCIGHIISHFNALDKEQQRMESLLAERITSMLQENFRDNDLFVNIVIDWYKKNKVSKNDEILLTLPLRHKKMAEQLCDRLRHQILSEPKVTFHSYDFFQVKSGDQLIEFNSDEFIATLIRHLVYNNEAIQSSIRNISYESREQLKSLLL
ncbi:hypothetical protein [Winslowiella iniecta]|uniref:Oxygen-regulated invasion protein OrgB n=1 Tax=Winslowiella iniecta TaxID=1560201 RepID=A0A0L7T8B3_9GAMM|nr:hypothetical protein [Winslowiella iniecta]KOC91615.1 hypothetical protein NG42_05095 [Winslowiella iniecta]KOC94434.1 hypothetical protein NG43_04410 [Winslowiella iniecta]